MAGGHNRQSRYTWAVSLPHSTSSDPQSRLIVALDVPTAAEALALVDRMDGAVRWVKVGMELYYAAGPAIVAEG